MSVFGSFSRSLKFINMSTSTQAREEGNSYYRNAGVDGLAPILRKDRYEKALQCYNRANQLASSSDEEASALKNIANAARKLACLAVSQNEKRMVIAHYYHEAVKNFNLAFHHGKTCKPSEWRESIATLLSVCLEEAMTWAEDFSCLEDRLRLFEFLSQNLTIQQIAIEFHLKIGKMIFHDGATKLQNSDYKGCLSRMRDCYYHLEEAKRLGRVAHDSDRDQEIRILEKDVHYHTSAAESIQARNHGRQLLDVAIQQQEEINIDLIWDVVDWYKQATILARELELEQEAIALSYLGYVYDRVLKIQSKAKTYYMRSMQLADSLRPRTFFTDAWYSDCGIVLKRYQDEVRQKEEEEKRKSYAGFLEQLSEELKELDEHNTKNVEFLQFVYNKYPPTLNNWKKPSDSDMEKWANEDCKTVKSLLQKAVIAYHPDKVDEEKHGKKWKVLSEEITKRLTNYYECLK